MRLNKENKYTYWKNLKIRGYKIFTRIKNTKGFGSKNNLTESQKRIQKEIFKGSETKFNVDFVKTFYRPIKNKLSVAGPFQYIVYIWKKTKINHGINLLITGLLLSSFLLFFIYLSFFDRYFLVKNYKVEFPENSYLSKKKTTNIIKKLQNEKVLGVIPKNQFWFVNSLSLSADAKKLYPEISEISVSQRYWPNKIKIKITTEPVLLTLKLNNNQYWRVNKDGRVVGKDEANLYKNLVIVDRPVSLISNGNTTSLTKLDEYSFKGNKITMEKFWFIINMWQVFDKLDFKLATTHISSLSRLDNEVTFVGLNGTEIRFSNKYVGFENQKIRLQRSVDILTNPKITKKIKYIDLKIDKKIYVCYQDAVCANK